MLTMHFHPNAELFSHRLTVDAPYELVARFILDEAQGSVHGATQYAKMLREVMTGARPPIECETGNSWTMDADPEWTTLSNTYGTRPLEVRLPTSWLLDAVERWRQYLIDRGYPLDQ